MSNIELIASLRHYAKYAQVGESVYFTKAADTIEALQVEIDQLANENINLVRRLAVVGTLRLDDGYVSDSVINNK